MAISRSLMNRQLRADGGIMQVAPREKFGLGSKLKKFVRKIIPNEVADIAVKAAPFVAPFNPAVAAAMSGLGTFDQTGSIGDSLKGGALTYGLGQGARYLGGAGFQGNPFAADGGAFRGGLEGFKSGFTSPLGNQTGFKLGKPVQEVQGVGIDTSRPLQKPDILSEQMSELSLSPSGAVTDVVVDKSIVTQNDPGFLKDLFDGVSNQDYGKIAKTIGDGAKKFGKAMFTKPNPIPGGKPLIDKAAVLGAITFATSYAEARALAAETGVDEDLTEAEYDELKKADKQEEYAGYLTNFFGGRKDGGRIGFESGANEMIKTQLLEEIMPNTDTTTEDYVIIMTEDGPRMILKSNLPSESMMMDTTTSVFGDAGQGRRIPEELRADGGRIGFKKGSDPVYEMYLEDLEAGIIPSDKSYNEYLDDIEDDPDYDYSYAKGGRVSRKFGSPKEGESEIGIMAIDVEAGDDEDEEDMMMAGGITFSSAEKSYLFRRLGGAGGADRSFTMPQLYGILKNPNSPANIDDAKVLKEIAIMGLGKGQKDGGRIGFNQGSLGGFTTVKNLGIKKEEIEPKFQYDLKDLDIERDKSKVLVMDEDGSTKIMDKEIAETLGLKIIADSFDTELIKKAKGGRIGYKKGGGTDKMEQYKKYVSDMIKDGETPVDFEEFLEMTNYKDGGRIGFNQGSTSIGNTVFGDISEIDIGESIKKSGRGLINMFSPSEIMRILSEAGEGFKQIYFNLKSDSEKENLLKTIMGDSYEQKAKGGRIGYKGGANRVSELLILRDELIGKGEDVSDIEAEIFQLTGKTFRSVGGISDIPTGKIRKNNAGVVERDYRDEGGFVPVGIKERADDVPAMLSKNEFVMTADAVRGIGNGSVEEGSKKLYNTMKKAEQVGKA